MDMRVFPREISISKLHFFVLSLVSLVSAPIRHVPSGVLCRCCLTFCTFSRRARLLGVTVAYQQAHVAQSCTTASSNGEKYEAMSR